MKKITIRFVLNLVPMFFVWSCAYGLVDGFLKWLLLLVSMAWIAVQNFKEGLNDGEEIYRRHLDE